MNSVTLVILSTILGGVTPFTYSVYNYPEPCPKVEYITDLDFTRILGFWYRCFSNLDCPSCLKNKGQTVYAYPYNSTSSGVAICCEAKSDPKQVTCSPEVGTGFINPSPNPGVFIYISNGQSYDTVVLDMDDTYLISYACKAKEVKSHRGRERIKVRDEELYVYSRSYHDCKSLEDRVRCVLNRNNIEWSIAKPVEHGPTIPYTTVPEPCPKN